MLTLDKVILEHKFRQKKTVIPSRKLMGRNLAEKYECELKKKQYPVFDHDAI